MGYPLMRGPGLLYGGVWGSHETITTTVKVHQLVNLTPFLASFPNSFLSLGVPWPLGDPAAMS